MAQLSLEPLGDYYDYPWPTCETHTCEAVSEVRVEQTHQDDGESWALCHDHALGFVENNLAWVSSDGGPHEEPPPATCRVCGCTDDDCAQCIAKDGHPCAWLEADLCTSCGPTARPA